MSRIVQNAVLNSSPFRTLSRGLARLEFSFIRKWTHNKHQKNDDCEEDHTPSEEFCFVQRQQNGSKTSSPFVKEDLEVDESRNSSKVDHTAFQFNSGALYNNLTQYMRPQAPLSQKFGHEIAAVKESVPHNLKLQEGAATTAVKCPLLLIKGSLHKVRRQRTFAFDIGRTPALAFIPGSHKNFCRVFSYLHRKDQKIIVDTQSRDEGRGTLNRENLGKTELEKQVVEFYETFRLVKEAQKILALALRQFYASLEKKKADQKNIPNLAQSTSAKYLSWNWEGDESGGFSNKDLKVPSHLKSSKPLMICARAHKNIGYALHFLQLANQSLHKENTSQNAEDQIHKKNHSNFMYKAIILLEAADGNLRMLFKHLRTKTKEDIEGGKRRGRKRRGYSGAGPRSLVLKGNMTDGRNLGQKLFHTLSFNRTRQYFLETKPQNQLYLANHSSKKQEEVPVQEIEILALLSKVDGLGRFLQEIHDNYTNKRGSKEIIAKEIETLVFLLKAHKQLCEIITKMNIILASLERDRRIKKEMDIFIGEPISVKSNKITKQKQDENLTKVKTDKAKVDIAQSMRDSKNKQDKKQLNEKVNVKISETDDSEGENLK